MKQLIYAAALAILMVLALSPATHAVDDPVRITMAPISTSIELQPNTRTVNSFDIYNSGEAPFRFSVYAQPYTVRNLRYDPVFDVEQPNTQIRRWISFPRTTYELAPKHTVTVPYVITTPATLPDGGQYAAIFAQTDGSTTDNLTTEKRVGMILYAHAKGKTRYAGTSQLDAPPRLRTEAAYTMQTQLRNTGNVDFVVTTTLEIRRQTDNSLVYSHSLQKPIIPDTTRSIELPWQGTTGLFDRYTVTQRVDYLGKHDTRTDTMIVVSPIFIPIGIAVTVGYFGILAWIVWLLIRRIRRHKHGEPKTPEVS